VILLFSTVYVTNAQDDQCGDQACPQILKHTEYGLPEEVILAYADLDFETLPVETSLLHDRRYMQVAGMVNVYDAPDGTITRTIDQGFSYVTVNDQRGNWTQINPGEWVQSAYLQESNHPISEFTGVFLPEALPVYPIAWTLVDSYPSSLSGGDAQESNGSISRYRLVSLFDAVEIDGDTWFQVGVDQWLDETHVAQITPVQRPEAVDTRRWISIDLHEQVLVAYDGERPIFATLVSAGLPGTPTYQGLFHITLRMPRRDMSWGTPGKDFYYLEEVPWTMFFDDGRALHGTYWHDDLGYLHSRGCLNMSITDAHWLFLWVAEQFGTMTSVGYEQGPAVYIYSSDGEG
jgi:hypothetical protein